MTDALIEKVARAICRANCPTIGITDPDEVENQVMGVGECWSDEARAAILAVLDHFSEPSNVTDGMVAAGWGDYHESVGTGRKVIANTFRAARDEVSRDK